MLELGSLPSLQSGSELGDVVIDESPNRNIGPLIEVVH
jgi:hypothetical protein